MTSKFDQLFNSTLSKIIKESLQLTPEEASTQKTMLNPEEIEAAKAAHAKVVANNPQNPATPQEQQLATLYQKHIQTQTQATNSAAQKLQQDNLNPTTLNQPTI